MSNIQNYSTAAQEHKYRAKQKYRARIKKRPCSTQQKAADAMMQR